MDGDVPKNVTDWQGKPWNPSSGAKAAHPNSRFTLSVYNADMLSKEFDNPKGVPISAMIFGGKRSHLIPLVFESLNWQHGVFMAARMGSETTAAAIHQEGVLRRDPMAMLPFCGYNMGDYFRHWLDIGKRLKDPPKIFCVNWFRKDDDGSFLWPGFGENIRVLEWVMERVRGRVGAKETPIGRLPNIDDLDLKGLSMPKAKLEKLFEVEPEGWKEEVGGVRKFFSQFGNRLPKELMQECDKLSCFFR
jgi:phosphoenolpyruvate carboxykinase (GTP)